MAKVAEYARGLPRSDGRLGLLGHSMASDIIVRFAQRTRAPIEGTVAVSMFAPTVTSDTPGNMLVIVGGLEPRPLLDEAKRAVALKQGVDSPSPGTVYGSFDDGTARGWRIAPRVEHIGVLYSPESLRAARDWLNRSFGRESSAGARDLGSLDSAAGTGSGGARPTGIQPAADGARAAGRRRPGLAAGLAGDGDPGRGHAARALGAADRFPAACWSATIWRRISGSTAC